MEEEILKRVLCPRCYSGTSVRVDERHAGFPWNGEISCGLCGSTYPLKDGIAFLSAVDRTWKPMIREFISKVEVTETARFEGGFETDRKQEAEKEIEQTAEIMDDLFKSASRRLDISPGTRLLDVGAGLCESSRAFACMGARVVASDVDYTYLQSAQPEPPGTAGTGQEGQYFSRVMCDAHRLPFPDASFDVTCCRSTIHHLNGIPSALREMARVTAPGGRVVLISEPIRSVFDSEISELEGVFDYEQGLNERKVPVYYYTVPMRLYCRGLTVEYFVPGYKDGSARVFRALHFDYPKHFRAGEVLGFARSFKLLVSAAGLNVFGIRSGRRARKPRGLKPEEIVCDVRDLVISDAATGDGEDIGESARLRTYRDHLRALHRGLLDRSVLGEAIDAGTAGREILRKGFREPEAGGFRYTHKRANCYLKNDPSAEMLVLKMKGFPAGVPESSGTVLVNSLPAGGFSLEDEDWKEVCLPKPIGVRSQDVLEVEIRNDTTFVPDSLALNGDTRELGAALKSVRQR